MKTKEQYFKDEEEAEKIRSAEREEKWTQEIKEEIKDWDFDKLKEKYIQARLARISYYNPVSAGMGWEYFHEICRFCGLKYIQGAHDECCDNCWEENKGKTLAELE